MVLAEQVLWLAVLTRAFSDLTLLFGDTCGEGEKLLQDSAYDFFFGDDENLDYVCALAGVNSDMVKKYANYLIDSEAYYSYTSNLDRMLNMKITNDGYCFVDRGKYEDDQEDGGTWRPDDWRDEDMSAIL